MSRSLPILLLVVLAGPAAGQPARTHDVTPDDYFTLKTITEIAVSPDGKQVAYCLAAWDTKADNRRTDLWVVSTDGKGTPKQLTTDRANDRKPKWAADGKAVYVLANRKKEGVKEPPLDGKPQVWKVPLDGGDPSAVTTGKDGVTGYDYAPTADAIFYSVGATATDDDAFSPLRKKFANPEYGSGSRKVTEVYRKAGDEAKKLIAEGRYLHDFAVTADGNRVAMISAPDDQVVNFEGKSRVDVWEGGKVTPTDESWRKTAASPWPWLESLAWNPAGTRLAYCTVFDGHPAEVIVGEWKDGQWTAKRMPRSKGNHVRGYGTPLQWLDATSLAYFAERAGRVESVTFDLTTNDTYVSWGADGFRRVEYAMHYVPGPGEARASVAAADGFPLLRCYPPGENTPEVTLLDPNPHTKAWKLPTVEHITWTASDGTTVGGPLELPFGYKKGGKKLPLVVAIHGGPTTASHADLEFDPHNGRLYFAAKGYAVLCPNYRGSTGYGDKFVTDLIGRENEVEAKDIIAGIQHLITEGIVDPERVAVMGWSNGGYLTNCLISLKDPPVKIKAASSGAGIVDTVAEWGFNDEPAYPMVFKKGLPWETPDVYRKTSPTYQLGNVKTPTLIHVGGGDVRCPPGHSRMLYRALREYVKVPTELVVYPGEPHGLTKASNRKAKMEWDLAWFEKYLK